MMPENRDTVTSKQINYIVKGSVRGHLGEFESIDDAHDCMLRDHDKCRALGGGAHSDACVFFTETSDEAREARLLAAAEDGLEGEEYEQWEARTNARLARGVARRAAGAARSNARQDARNEASQWTTN